MQPLIDIVTTPLPVLSDLGLEITLLDIAEMTGAVDPAFMPLGGLAPLLLIQFGEVIFGGVGSGVYGILMFVLLTVFMAGLMVGRTPESVSGSAHGLDGRLGVPGEH